MSEDQDKFQCQGAGTCGYIYDPDRGDKKEKIPKGTLPTSPSFKEVESAIRSQDREKAAVLMAAFYRHQGGPALARHLLLLGSGYLDHSLGHSVSWG